MRTATATLLCLLALAMGCSTLKVSSDWDPEADYSKVGSYAWIGKRSGVEGTSGTNSLLDQRIRRAVEAALAIKGIPEVSREKAEILVSYHIGIEQKLDVHSTYRGYGYGYRGRGGYRGGGYTDTYVSQYEEGTFLLDMIDPDKMELVWRGTAQSRISKRNTPEEREARVREVVDAVLALFPPSR